MDTTKRSGRRWLSWTIIGGGTLVALLALGAHKRGVAAMPVGDRTPSPSAAPAPLPSIAAPAPVVRPAPSPTPEAQAQPRKPARPRVEVVFALDTTGSMGGLIEGAKRKIWSIASYIAKGQPAPDLKVGLVAYRDIGDEYVTRSWNLDGDMDRVFQRLSGLRADGGGDTPEHVAKALHDSVTKMSWSGGQEVLRMIYLVGDAPAHTDYTDGFDFAKEARAAQHRGIQVHAIRCGSDGEAGAQWRKIAMLGHGEFLSIGADGGMRTTRTPYDEEMARLSDKLGHTVMGYGRGGGGALAGVRAAEAAPVETKAARAEFLTAKGKAVGGEGDLVADVAAGKKLSAIAKDDMPAEIRDLPAPAQAARIDEMAKERQKVQQQIQELARKRESYLDKEAAASGGPAGFDKQVEATVKKNASAVGIKY